MPALPTPHAAPATDGWDAGDAGFGSELRGADRSADWPWQLRNCVRSVAQLERALKLVKPEREGVQAAERAGFPLRVTPYYLSLCNQYDERCPLRRQVVPHIHETHEVRGDLSDPLGEEAHEVAPRLIRRYPDRALLLVTRCCAVHCRFCTRRRGVGPDRERLAPRWLGPALTYLGQHPEVREVIVSGGDPLILETAELARIVAAVRTVPSVETIRLATRTPVVLPQRITTELLAALRPFQPLWVMTHFNHPKELALPARQACRRLADGGFPVMNQTVLLRGINDDPAVLAALFRGLVRERVRPHYLLQADPVRGSGHLRTPLGTGVRIMEQLQGRLSGIALPKLIVDTPGGHGKVPLLPDYVVRRSPGVTRVRTFCGAEVDCIDPE